MLYPGPALDQGIKYQLGAGRISYVGGRQFTASRRPSVSTVICLFRPLIFLCAS
jgi:hypothetical protein